MRTIPAALLSILTLGVAACNTGSGEANTGETTLATPEAQEAQGQCVPLETREANAPDQRPAFEGQTRTCGIRSNVQFDVTVVATGLSNPWSVEPLPGGDLLVTEKPGTMRIVSASGQVGEPLAGIPAVVTRNQGGLLDVALSPNFATDRTIFWSFSEARGGNENATSVARGVLSEDRRSVEQVRVIFQSLPAFNGGHHYGSRIAFAPDGTLHVTTGDRSAAEMRQHAQRLDGHLGKVMRINADGTVPQDNPFVGRADAKPEIFSLGHRNIQAAAFDPQGRLWTVEHGTRGGDELNLVRAGGNYGWPVQAYGIEYSGQALPGVPVPADSTLRQPVYYWDPVIAPSGAQFYTGDAFPEWQGSMFIGALREQRLVRLVIEGERVVGEEHLLTDRQQRVRDVKQGPDGFLYVVTDEENGELWRISPRAGA